MDNVILRAQGVWSVEDAVGGGAVRCFLIAGSARAVLIDTGNDLPRLPETVGKLTNLPITLLVSHADHDHVSCNHLFPDRMAHPDEAPLLAKNTPGLDYQPLTGGVIDLGGRALEVIHGPGHTPGSLAFFDRAAGILFPGDTVSEATVYQFGEARDPLGFIATQAKFAALGGVKTILPCHGPCPIAPDGLFEELALAQWRVLAGEKSSEIFHMVWPDKEFDVFVHRCGRASVYSME